MVIGGQHGHIIIYYIYGSKYYIVYDAFSFS